MLFAEESTIIDTIWTENSLQGAIGYHVQNGTYYGGIIPSGQYSLDVGDSYDPFGDFNDISLRAYLSFTIQIVPADMLIDSVFIMAYQWGGANKWRLGFSNLV